MSLKVKLELLDLLEEKKRRAKSYTVVGLVCPIKGLTHSLSNKTGTWTLTQSKPTVYIAAKLEKALVSKKRYIVIFGGRGSTKSLFGGDLCLIDAKDNGAKTFFLREFQSSIKASVHTMLGDEIERLEFDGFEVMNQTIKHKGKDVFEFAGLSRNISNIKSSHGFARYAIEEAEFLTNESIEKLTPTARNKARKGLPLTAEQIKELDAKEELNTVSMLFILNPQSSEDPMSKRFLTPYQDALDRDGFYEDDLHLIIKINYTDNPWFVESGLEQDRLWWFNNSPRSLYDHVWKGAYNDSIEGALIQAEWFDACIDAHIKLGFKPTGARIAAHDPSDIGPDSKGYAMRHGVVVLDVQEMIEGDGNEGGRWAAGLANAQQVDYFTWDCDGMGAVLNEQMAADFKGKRTTLAQFKGSERPDNPEAIYNPALKSNILGQVKVKDAIKNKRAQYYVDLRDRIYRTYLAVTKPDECGYQDPDTLISFSSDIALLSKLRGELCRMPIKPDNGAGKIELYTKDIMKTKFKVKSPNLADSVMMSMRFKMPKEITYRMPRPIQPMGLRR